jgi:putative FmdB family regulatory protein
MILWDWKCPACGRIEEVASKTPYQAVYCKNCETQMDRLLSKPNFNIQGYNYKNGYSKPNSNN